MVCYDSPIKIVLDTCSINGKYNKHEVLKNESNKINDRQSKIAEIQKNWLLGSSFNEMEHYSKKLPEQLAISRNFQPNFNLNNCLIEQPNDSNSNSSSAESE